MAWIDAQGVTHSLWLYEPLRVLGPRLSASIDSASDFDLQSAAELLTSIMTSVFEDVGQELTSVGESCAERSSEMELPEGFQIETSLLGVTLADQVQSLVRETVAEWRVEVLFALNEVIHDRIDQIHGSQ